MLMVIAECHVPYALAIEQREKANVPGVLTMDIIQSLARFIAAAKKKKLNIAGCALSFPVCA